MIQVGYVSFGKYGGEKTIAGKPATRFSLSYMDNGERKYLNNVTAWHEDTDPREIAAIQDGRYIGIQYTASEREKDGKLYTNYSLKHVWLRADGYDGLEAEMSDNDLPF